MSDNGPQRPPPNYNRPPAHQHHHHYHHHHHHFAHPNTPNNNTNSPPLHDQYKLTSPPHPPSRLEPFYEPFGRFDRLDRFDHFDPLPSPPPGRPSQSRFLPPPPPAFRDILNPVEPQDRAYKRITVPAEAAAHPQSQFSPPPQPFQSPPRRYKPLGPAFSPTNVPGNPSPFPGPTFSPPTPSTSASRSRYIDLTTPQTSSTSSSTSSSASSMPPRRAPKSRPYVRVVDSDDSDEEGPSTKRRRVDPQPDAKPPVEINLTDDSVNPLEAALQKQHAEAVKAQQADGEKPRGLKTLTCVICLDTPKDLTATSCGHVFCHECLVNALIAGENRSRGRGEPKRSQCPVCRKTIQRSKTLDVVPLLMKKALATQPRRLMKQAIT